MLGTGISSKLGDQKDSILKLLDTHANELAERVEKVRAKIEQVDGNVNRLRKQQAAAAKATHKKLAGIIPIHPLQSYYKALREHFSPYDNVGLPVSAREGDEETDHAITIRDLFVAPHCADHRVRPAELDAAIREGKKLGKPFLPTLQQPRLRTVLLADPGMGKSTVIQWLIATLAAEKVPENAEDLRGAIPLPFIVREIVLLLPAEVTAWNWDAVLDAFRRWNPRGAGCAPIAATLVSDDESIPLRAR